MYDSFTLLYGRNQHNIVKQLSSNLKKEHFERKNKHTGMKITWKINEDLNVKKRNLNLWQIPSCNWTFSSALPRTSQQDQCKQSCVSRWLWTTLCSETHYNAAFNYYRCCDFIASHLFHLPSYPSISLWFIVKRSLFYSIVSIHFGSGFPVIKSLFRRTSLVVQWLRVCLTMQRTQVQSLIGELRSHMPWSN